MCRNFFGQRQNLQKLPVEERLIPKYQEGYPLDMAVYLTEQPNFSLSRCISQSIGLRVLVCRYAICLRSAYAGLHSSLSSCRVCVACCMLS